MMSLSEAGSVRLRWGGLGRLSGARELRHAPLRLAGAGQRLPNAVLHLGSQARRGRQQLRGISRLPSRVREDLATSDGHIYADSDRTVNQGYTSLYCCKSLYE